MKINKKIKIINVRRSGKSRLTHSDPQTRIIQKYLNGMTLRNVDTLLRQKNTK